MSALAWVGAIAVLAAGAIALVSAGAVWAMRDPIQRLHFVTPAATLSAALVSLGFWVSEPQKAAAAKVSVAMALLVAANAVVTHATARAIRVRAQGGHR